MVGGLRLGRPHEPDVVAPGLVVECKNEKGLAVSSRAIEQARRGAESGPGEGLPWAVFKRQKGSRRFVVVLDGDHALELLRKAGVICRD